MLNQSLITGKIVEDIKAKLRAGWDVERIAKWHDIPWTWVQLVKEGK